jgi:hypothetical protein
MQSDGMLPLSVARKYRKMRSGPASRMQQRAKEFVWRHGFHEVQVEADGAGMGAILRETMPSDRNQRYVRGSGVGADLLGQFVPVHSGQPDINNRCVNLVIAKNRQRRRTIRRLVDDVSAIAQEECIDFAGINVIIDQEDPFGNPRRHPWFIDCRRRKR